MNHRFCLLQKLEGIETTFKKVFFNQQVAAPQKVPPGAPRPSFATPLGAT